MNIIFFVHPAFLHSQSMPRFAHMLARGMQERGHQVEVWTPQPRFFKLSVAGPMQKWMGYLDQFILFPAEVFLRVKACSPDTLFVFTDQALGPWVPLVSDKPHIIHCHDFLAQYSALGQIPENPTAWTGRRYQDLIRRGYSRGKHFISVSEKTREDLHLFLQRKPETSEVVHNGLNGDFRPGDPIQIRTRLGEKFGIDLSSGYLLHVGGNQWYKNRSGVVEIYNAWRSGFRTKLPLLLIGKTPDTALQQAWDCSEYRADIHTLTGVADADVQSAYAGASLFLFPSLAEGFGWPIAEAMASGCPLITTDEDPMAAVAGRAGFLIPRRPLAGSGTAAWAKAAAEVVNHVLSLSAESHQAVVEAGILNARRFDTCAALNRIETIYQKVVQTTPDA